MIGGTTRWLCPVCEGTLYELSDDSPALRRVLLLVDVDPSRYMEELARARAAFIDSALAGAALVHRCRRPFRWWLWKLRHLPR